MNKQVSKAQLNLSLYVCQYESQGNFFLFEWISFSSMKKMKQKHLSRQVAHNLFWIGGAFAIKISVI